MSSSLRKWFDELPWMMQGTLLSAVRGPDNTDCTDSVFKIVRAFRSTILKPAGNKTAFLRDVPSIEELHEAMNNFILTLRAYPFHFVIHLMFAVEIIGYKHPDKNIKKIWMDFYIGICKNLHVNPETEDQLDNRLKDNPNYISVYQNE